jgi:hypothetical protein
MQRISSLVVLFLSTFIILFNGDVLGQLSPEQMKEDVLELKKSLGKNHPGLYWYTSRQQFDSIWHHLDTQIDSSMTDGEFLKLLLPVVASVKCSHTLFYPSKEIMSRGTRFPLTLDFMQGKGYILRDAGIHNIPIGSELVAINGITLDKIVNLILPALQAQGGNPGWKYVILENDFQNYYYYIVEQTDNFIIEYIDPNTKEKIKKELKGVSDQNIRTHWSKWYPGEVGAPLSISFPNDNGVAVLTIRSLSKGRYKMYKQDFEATLAKYFKEIKEKEIKNLIIDLRGNEGGNNPELIYSYIAKPGDRNVKGSADYIEPAKETFRGPVFVLMNERSISSQETFVAIFKNNNRGLTIGRHTSGSYNGLCGGNKRKIVLPNSRFEINIPLHAENWTFNNATPYQAGQGFPPDIQVEESIDDIMGGKDAVMQVALERFSKL